MWLEAISRELNAVLQSGGAMHVRNKQSRKAALIFLCISPVFMAWSQKITGLERDRAQSILHDVAADVRKHYYDPKFHGLDWDAKVLETKKKIDEADSGNKALLEIAALLDSLNDSHTLFVPPRPRLRHDYGWQAQLIGDRCYVIRVRPDSDAEVKGVKPGDEILGINGYAPTRKTFAKISYFFDALRPQASLRLVLRDPAGNERTTNIAARIIERHPDLGHSLGGRDIRDKIREMDWARESGPQVKEMGDELMILKFPHFFFSEEKIDGLIGKARKHKALILDLRANGGGSLDTLKYLLGGVFDEEIKIGDRVSRDERKALVARKHGHCFDGKLLVLVGSGSASASELFARVVQIEKRGVVLGDLSSGMVMEAQFYSYDGVGAEITDADIIMTDGKSLEHVGVTPDQVVLPTAADLANSRDPVMARAAELAGVKLTPEAAGKLFPYEWPPQ
jgi:C-terminal processing protease CtpA/Prc